MNWISARHILKKIWTWLKTYWYVPVLLMYTLIMMKVFRRDGKSVLEVLSITKESYKKQVDILQEVHEKEIKKRDEIVTHYNEVIKKVDEEYRARNIALDAHKKKRIKSLVRDYHDDPEHLTQLLKITFGIHYEEG